MASFSNFIDNSNGATNNIELKVVFFNCKGLSSLLGKIKTLCKSFDIIVVLWNRTRLVTGMQLVYCLLLLYACTVQ